MNGFVEEHGQTILRAMLHTPGHPPASMSSLYFREVAAEIFIE